VLGATTLATTRHRGLDWMCMRTGSLEELEVDRGRLVMMDSLSVGFERQWVWSYLSCEWKYKGHMK
jgi:hypothetical protein